MQNQFREFADHLLSDALSHLERWLPAGKRHGREYCVGSLSGEAGESLKINIDKGVWTDFATGVGGADLLDLYCKINSVKPVEALKHLGADFKPKQQNEYLSGIECISIPKHTLGRPTNVFEYKTTAGTIIGYICRFEPVNEPKQFIPLTFWKQPSGTCVWIWKKWPIMSPLYRAEKIPQRPQAKILIVEGEKKCDRAQLLLPDWIVVGWSGGANAIKKTDWSPLQGRTTWMWPDADQPGLEAADSLKKLIPKLNVVDIASIEPHLPEGWDLGDAPDDYNAAQYLVTAEKPKAKQAPALQESTLAARLDKINSECAVIFHGSKVLIMRHWMGQDNQSKLIFMSPRDFLSWQENNMIYVDDGKGGSKQLKVGKAWMEWSSRQEFDETYFDPCGEVYSRRYNLWNGFAYEPNPEAGPFNLLLAHIHDNICQKDPERFAWIIAWLADLFQRPNRKLGTALVLRGPMGIGKGVFANHVGKLLGKHYMPISQSSQLVGKFNSHMADKILMFVDEGWWSDDKGYAEGILRNLITEPQVTIEMKGKDAVTYSNYTRFIIAANADWVVPVGASDERRFNIFDVGVDNQRDAAYFAAIDKQMKGGGYESFLHFLLNYQYDESLPRTIINTQALLDNKIHSMPVELKWLYDCLKDEQIGDCRLGDSLENDISCSDFYDNYQNWCEKMKKYRPLTRNSLPVSLRKANIFLSRKRKVINAAGHRQWYYLLPNLSVMRTYFEEFLGGEIDWDGI